MLEKTSPFTHWSKFITSLLVLMLASNASAQLNAIKLGFENPAAFSLDPVEREIIDKDSRKSGKLTFTRIEISGGFLNDVNDFYERNSSEFRNEISRNDYAGINYLSLGVIRQKDNLVYGLAFEGYKYEFASTFRTVVNGDIYQIEPDLSRSKIQLQTIFHLGRQFNVSKKYKLVLAPMIGIGGSKELYTPYQRDFYSIRIKERNLGFGVLLKNQFQLSNRIGISLGTRIFLLDGFDERIEAIYSSTIPWQRNFNFEFIRNEFLVQLGINYTI